ncbi:MAG TPA: hypothetical protein VMF88_11770 [Bacteroidota bacterium]|nr:hypothetical protein [Bacteroidota bacterium]
MKISTLIIFITLFLLSVSCRKEPPTNSPSPTSCDSPPGNRNFTWRTDTIAWWPSEVGGVWAFSDNDAWVVGNLHGPTVPGQTSYIALHWNGTEWKDTIQFTDVFAIPNDVTGDNRYMVAAGYLLYVGEKPAIAEFDNSTKKWSGYQFQTPGVLYSVWTDKNGFFIAVGDSGMVYTKDGYSSQWVYSKAPTNFTFNHVNGVSKTEIYASGYSSLASGSDYEQYWKYDGIKWSKLFDNQDTVENVISLPGDYSVLTDINAYRCSATDSLQLYLGGFDSFLLQSKGQSLNFAATNLSSLGLPFHSFGSVALVINIFSPNDVWFCSARYESYQWNGSTFQQIIIPGIPPPESGFGAISRIVKTSNGKAFFSNEVSPQVYVVAQGTP